jgi:dipeptidyl aminopeptidase/acylaminoacyl peptidase
MSDPGTLPFVPRTAPYGSWASPITAESIARGSISLAEPTLADDCVWWVESRPLEGGRQVIVRASADGSERRDAFGPDFSARARVHEYGGGAYALAKATLVFSNDADGRLYRVDPDAPPAAITPPPQRLRSLRYADLTIAGDRVVCVRESHEANGREPVNEVVSVPLESGEPTVIATGSDFYAAPRVSSGGEHIAWLAWDHPRMPWDGTELYVDGERVAGGTDEAIVNPEWSLDGVLHWVSDRSGWWNLYRDGEPIHQTDAEFAMPLWVFGQASYAFLDDGRIACAWSRMAEPHLGVLDPITGELDELQPELVPTLRSLRLTTDGRRVAYVGASPTRTAAVVVYDVESGELTPVAESTNGQPDSEYLSTPEPITFASDGRTAYALYYPPRNAAFDAPAGELPPLLVISHGGPTAQAEPALDLRTQFWTSRGFAVVDVNYGGSTGYGRAYRELLRGQWGVVDVRDCIAAAEHLAGAHAVDPERLAIRGSSAGGYTTLCALVFTDAFHAGASYYGIADLEVLMADTHKFESRYESALVPPDQIHERSPIHFVERISAAVIVFQGLDDPVVPPQQAELIVAALAERGLEHEYHSYEGESHGFRKAETIVDSLTKELAFYGRVLGFEPA